MLKSSKPLESLSKAAFRAIEPELRQELLEAQFALRKKAAPVLLLIAGDDRLGATGVFNRLHEWLDARDVSTHAFGPPTAAEAVRPSVWRYWRSLPPAGRIGIWLGGWAQSPLTARLDKRIDDSEFEDQLASFKDFERLLLDDGTVVLKVWIHLSGDAHQARAEKGKGSTWRLDEIDWRICDEYEALAPLASKLLAGTHTDDAPWLVIDGSDPRARDVAVARAMLAGLQRAIAKTPATSPSPAAKPRTHAARVFDSVDLTKTLPDDEYDKRLEKLQKRVFKRMNEAEAAGLRSVLVFEGWDAAGKGGAIRRITTALDARDYRVLRIAAPDAVERSHPYLWRFWRDIPAAGKVALFDRSWYGRVLVERVEGFAAEPDWRRAYAEIVNFERQLTLADTVVQKFWLHIDPDEQMRRFKAREHIGYKRHKITEEDYRNREKWDDYLAAVDEMVERTDTKHAPWHLIPANDKRTARIEVLDAVCDALKAALKDR